MGTSPLPNYNAVQEKMEEHRKLSKRIADIKEVLAFCRGELPDIPTPGGLSDSRSPVRSKEAIIHISMSNGSEEIRVPVEECADMIQNRLDELNKVFIPLDKKVRKWHKDAL